MLSMNTVWSITNLGDSALLLPLAVGLALWVGMRAPKRALGWFVAMVAVMALTTVTKVYYGITDKTFQPIDFRMISGHMVLSFAVWPVLGYALGSVISRRAATVGAMIAVIGCVIIGYTRLYGFHTPAEIIVGSLIGGSVSFVTLCYWRRSPLSLPYPAVVIPVLCVLAWACYGSKAPTNDWIEATAAWVRAIV